MKYCRSLIFLTILVTCSLAHAQNALLPGFSLSNINQINIADKVAYYQLPHQDIPSNRAELTTWLSMLSAHQTASIDGDRYVAAFTLINDTQQEDWFIYPYGSVVEH